MLACNFSQTLYHTKKYFLTNKLNNIHYKCSGLSKKLDGVIREKDCDDLGLWKKAVLNHLYWTAASTPDGNPDVMEAKWKSLVNHLQDIHEHDMPAFPACYHPPLRDQDRDKQWLVPGI